MTTCLPRPLEKALLAAAPAATVLLLAAALPGNAQNPPPRDVRFNRDIRPILSDNCFRCHGPDSGTRQAGLRLDREADAKAPRGGRPAIVPGSVEKSQLVVRISARGTLLLMPPPSSGKSLTKAQVRLLKRWIAQGARWEGHWAYEPVRRPPVPTVVEAPGVRGPGRGSARRPAGAVASAISPVDAFLLARMRENGLRPSPEADRRTLIRRLSLDLRGLPPTPEEVRGFLADTSHRAYERLVDRFLASPHYGERMAQWWLDLVRYADTVGYHGDQNVSVWPYRDYVIRAFNDNKPFDVFTREQLAGDLLPGATTEQKVASGYNRLGMMSTEGGVQDKEYRAKYAAERVRNASAVWLGATMGCAECHDHKFDPYTMKDFYRFAAFFADLQEKGFYDGGFDRGDWGPSLRLPSDQQRQRLEDLDRRIQDARGSLEAAQARSLAEGQARWEAEVRDLDARKALGWTALRPLKAESDAGSPMKVLDDSSVFVQAPPPAREVYTVDLVPPSGPITALRIEPVGDERLPGNGYARAGHFFVVAEVEASVEQPGSPPRRLALVEPLTRIEDEGFPAQAAIDGSPSTGWAAGVHARNAGQPLVLRLAEPLRVPEGGRLVVRLQFGARPRLSLGRFRVLASAVPGADLNNQGLPDLVLAALLKNPGQRSDAERAAIAGHYRQIAPELAGPRRALAALEAQRLLLLGEIPQTLISVSTEPRVIRVLPRGNWMDDSGEVVQPGTPEFLPGSHKEPRATRLDLADWLVSPKNPLTARVLVNRLWRLCFGVGLAKSVDNLGTQSEPPLHPELLDWLAAELMRPTIAAHPAAEPHRGSARVQKAGGTVTAQATSTSPHPWDIKHILRLIVTSRAYRQSSRVTPDLAARDPFNRYYARQSVLRLDAEFVRDMALSVAGMLSPRIGGPSVHPFQPPGYLAALNFPRREWATDTGEAQYRRGLYIHWQRTFVHPSLLAFDAPTREEATCARAVSNTPMQALVVLNDPNFVEAARVFAERIVRRGRSFNERLRFAFEAALSRPPKAAEARLLRRLLDSQQARYRRDQVAARRLISTGDWPVPVDLDAAEIAAWTAVARAILNLHEAITRA